MSFPLQAIRAIWKAVGNDYILGVRMTFDEKRPGGVTPEEGVRIARALTDEGIDFISVIRASSTPTPNSRQ